MSDTQDQASIQFTYADGIILALSLGTFAFVVYTVRVAFRKHHMNIFHYLMLVLILFALAGKCCL